MGVDNEQRLTNIIEEVELAIPNQMNKAEMIQIIKDFQVSISLNPNPEQQFNQQWTGNQNPNVQEGGDGV